MKVNAVLSAAALFYCVTVNAAEPKERQRPPVMRPLISFTKPSHLHDAVALLVATPWKGSGLTAEDVAEL